MSDAHQSGDEQTTNGQGSPEGADLLPPVEPPSPGFIIQLFVVPALIVIVIVAVWLLFNWLVLSTVRTPKRLIEGLEQGPAVARWQRASELADLLRNKRFAEFKRNESATEQLARILEREIERGSAAMDEGDVTLRYFLARALGEFETQSGVGVLLKAASTDRDPREQLVRTGALDALSVRAYNLRQLDPAQTLKHPDLVPTLRELARDDEQEIRLRVAFALGQIGTPAALAVLETMVDDADPDTRYNAAVGLAHRGSDAGIETLAEMVALEELSDARAEASEGEAVNQAVLVHTAMQAARELAEQNPEANLAPVIEELEAIATADDEALERAKLPSLIVPEVRATLEALRGAQAGTAP